METTSLTQPSHKVTWRDALAGEREEPYFKEITKFVERERKNGKVIYPNTSEVFNALQLTPFDAVKVVILGQDPYHGPNQAHGLSFSVLPGVPLPPSLQNIFKELRADLGLQPPSSGSLERWARQGVLLLNTTLTVESGRPMSHAKLGWEHFTDRIIKELNQRRRGIVFMLWGSHAQSKGAAIDQSRHLVLKAPHPSPLSAHRGFLGCRHFSKANEYLRSIGASPIAWDLNP
ncbi:MAG: uracil-DNA glycosylase [Proteobacteria bacterium]|nr:uracil-DNA glycosylase [Pseudomonadota bacterium]